MNNSDPVPLYQRILDHLTDAVLVFDPAYRLIYINVAGEMLLAVSSRQVLGTSAKELFFLYDQNIERDLKRTLQQGESLTKRNLALGLPSQAITVNFTITPMLEQDKPVAALVQIEQVDRHLRISMEEQLLAQQNAARMLLRGLAHEIKNPLGGLRGAAQLL